MRQWRRRRAGGLALLAAGALVVGLGAAALLVLWPEWLGGLPGGGWLTSAGEAPRDGVGDRVGAILAAPEAYYGRRVAVQGEVHRLVGAYAFTIGGETLWEEGQLLVLRPRAQIQHIQGKTSQPTTPPTARPTLPPDRDGPRPAVDLGTLHDVVVATGRLERFHMQSAERALGVSLDAALFVGWEGTPVLYAEEVALTAPAPGVLIDDILDDAGPYLGKTVRVRGTVGARVSPHAFTLRDADRLLADELLILDSTPPPAVSGWLGAVAASRAEPIAVTGRVITFTVAEVERALSIDLDDETFAQFYGAPAVLVPDE